MADTLTTNIKATSQTVGGNSNTWGSILNDSIEQIDRKFGDVTSVATTGGDTTLTDTQEIVNAIKVSGTLASSATLTFSGRGGFWVIKNNTSGAYTVTALVSGQTGVEIPQGEALVVWCDGTDIYEAHTGIEVADDTTPELGGALDGQGYDVINIGVITMAEQAAAEADVAGRGQIWVKSDTPNTPWFTNDAGTDFQLATLGGTETLVGKTLTSPVLNAPTVGTSLLPTTSDGAALGSATKMWSDLFMAAGAVANWNNGAVTLTEAAGVLTLAGSSFSALIMSDKLLTRPEIKDYSEAVEALGNVSGAVNLDFENGNVKTATITGNTDFTFTNPAATGKAGRMSLKLTNPGAYTVTFTNGKWAGGTQPTLTTSGYDWISAVTLDAGTSYDLFLGGLDFS